MNDGIDRNLVRDLAQKYGLSLVVLFGSRAKGTTGPMSDTDVLVAGTPYPAPLEEGKLRAALSEALGVPEDTIDLVFLDRAAPLVLSEALETGIVLFGDEDVIIRERVRAWKGFLDAQKFINWRRTYLAQSLTAVNV